MALKESILKILTDSNELDSNVVMSDVTCSVIIKKRFNAFKRSMETFKYGIIKNTNNRYDKANLEPIKYYPRL